MSGERCSLPTPDLDAEAAFHGVQTIAVVGLSPHPDRASHQVAVYLQSRGFHIIPVYPDADRILGEPAVATLSAIGHPVDAVDIFRKPAAVPAIVDEALRLGTRVIWMQEGISHEEAAAKGRAAGVVVVQNKCMKKVLQAADARPKHGMAEHA